MRHEESLAKRRAYDRAYYLANRDAIRARTAEHYRANREDRIRKQVERRFNVDREAMIDAQGGKCLICSIEFGDSVSPNVDHDHRCCPDGQSCGECVRGILCRACNNGLGNFADDPERLISAASYLLSNVNLLALEAKK
jgi:hypothetical protein